jgi:transmembrane sensor
MKQKEEILPLIVRYLDNSMEGGETEKLEQWLDSSNENRRILHAVDRIWKASEDKGQDSLISELNLENDWDSVLSQISAENPEEKRARVLRFRKLRKRQQFISGLLKVAAIVLVAFTSALITYHFAPHTPAQVESQEVVFNEITTRAAERANVELGDGSKVMLNAESRLIMPDRFSQDKREVELHGHAFFDIKSDRRRPFYIKTENAVIEVIGTSFDVRSYPDDEDMLVIVKEGTVELRRVDDPDNRLIVNEGYLGQVSRTNGRIALEMVEEADFYFGWMEGRLIFRDTPLADVFRQIERWYDVKVQTDLSERDLRRKKFSADLKTRSVHEVLDVIEMSMNIEIKTDGDKIFVSM